MEGPRPTNLQRFFASDWPETISFALCAGAGAVFAVTRIDVDVRHITWSLALLLAVLAILGAAVGFCAGTILLWPLFCLIYFVRERVNGGPFRPGDRVAVLRGPHEGTITTVRERWQGESVRVDLGPEADAKHTDIFDGTQLMRVAKQPLATPPGDSSPPLS